MAAPHNGALGQSRADLPAPGGSINGTRVLMGLLVLLIGIGAIAGVVFALSSGQPTIALIIGLVATAFFARVGC